MAGLSKPSDKDISKIHAEVNQIMHQRFLLCTSAITLFGIVIAWLVPKTVPEEGTLIDNIYFCITILLSILLFTIFYLYMSLKRMMRVFTAYLIATESSVWEKDYQRFRKSPYSAYTKPHTCMFLMLNISTILFPYLIALLYSLKIDRNTLMYFQIGTGLVTTLLVCGMGFWGWYDNEKMAEDRWNAMK